MFTIPRCEHILSFSDMEKKVLYIRSQKIVGTSSCFSDGHASGEKLRDSQTNDSLNIKLKITVGANDSNLPSPIA